MEKMDISKYTNINNRVKSALSNFNSEELKQKGKEINETYQNECKIINVLGKISYLLIIVGIILGVLWISSIIELALMADWKPGEKHWVNVLNPIALIYHETGLIYTAIPLAVLSAALGYALLKYCEKRINNALKQRDSKLKKLFAKNGLTLIRYCEKCKKQWPYEAAMCIKCGGKLEVKSAIDLNQKSNIAPENNEDDKHNDQGKYCYNCGKKLLKKHKYCP